MKSETRKTISVGLSLFIDSTTIEPGLMMAGAVLITVPALACFMFVQRFLVQGLAMERSSKPATGERIMKPMKYVLGALTALALLSTPATAQILQVLSAEGDPNSVAAIKWAASEFKKTHPNFDIAYQTVSFTEIGQKIIAATAAGSPPDFVHLDDFATSVLADQGMLETAGDVTDAIGRTTISRFPWAP